MRVDKSASEIKTGSKGVFLSNFFKKNIIKKFEKIKVGSIQFIDGSERYSFGDSNIKKSVKVEIFSPNFYVLLGSGGLMGVAEAYTLGYWKTNDLVSLIRVIFENKNIMNQMDSGLAIIFKPLNAIIHWFNKNSLSGSKKNILSHYDLSNDFYQL